MLIIFGFRVLFRTIGDGTFHCPSCQFDRQFHRRSARRWFTLFFIPVIPLNEVGEVIECTTCKRVFNPQVLDLPTTAETVESIGFARRALTAHMVDVSDNTTVARQAAVQVMRGSGMTDYGESQLDIDRQTSDWERVMAWAQHLGNQLSPAGAESMLTGAARVAAADGALTDAERTVLNDLGGRLGLTPLHIEGILHNAQTAKPAVD